jgi:hypothetical protein
MSADGTPSVVCPGKGGQRDDLLVMGYMLWCLRSCELQAKFARATRPRGRPTWRKDAPSTRRR